MESLARAGIEAFAVNLLGYGLSSRFELDDACSTKQIDQLRLLVSATGQPLFQVCSLPPDSRHFTNTAAAIHQLGAVVDHVLEEVNVEKASLFAWSRGGNVTGVYTSLDPPKVESLVLLASEFEFAALRPHRRRSDPVIPVVGQPAFEAVSAGVPRGIDVTSMEGAARHRARCSRAVDQVPDVRRRGERKVHRRRRRRSLFLPVIDRSGGLCRMARQPTPSYEQGDV